MKRFLVFAGDTYYSAGGWKDYVCDFDTIDCALTFVNARRTEEWCDNERCFGGSLSWVQVVDTLTSEPTIIFRCEDNKESK
jgi:hypothetical protein